MSLSNNHDVAHNSNANIPQRERVFGFAEHSSLWFSFGVGLLVMQMGAYLLPALSLRSALLVIVFGSLFGAGLLAWVTSLGCRYGLSSAALVGAALGSRFAILPVALNVIQLLGWAAFELVVMRDSSSLIIQQIFNTKSSWIPFVATLFWGGLLLSLSMASMTGFVRRFIRRFALPLIVLAMCWLSFKFLSQANELGWQQLLSRRGDNSLNFFSALDLVIAMPISWLPLAADYGRYGKSEKTTRLGAWLGYALANIWCYSLGVLIVSTSKNLEFISAILAVQGGLLALSCILLDEADNAYGDVHSAAVSANFLRKKSSIRRVGMSLSAVATLCALFLPMHRLETFLLLLSSIFVPLFGVVISQIMFALPSKQNQRWSAALLWMLGIAVFFASGKWMPEYGSVLPSLLFTFVLGSFLRCSRKPHC